MEVKEKFGQMLMLGLNVYDLNDNIINIIKEYKIGGVVLYKKNYSDIKSMIKFINKLKEINENNHPLFIAIDQENGRVNRLPSEILRMPSANKLAKSKNIEIVNECNEIMTNILSSVGINMNLAPVLDIIRDNNNKVIGNRSYGDNYKDVVKYGLPLAKTLKEGGIIPVIKHFPGHGITKGDSHIVIPKIKDVEEMEKNDLKVFEEAMQNDIDAIMVGHLRIKGYGLKPATMNKKIIDKYLYLYDGLIVTDDIKMNIIKYVFGLKRIIKNCIEANMNVIMIKYEKNDEKTFDKIIKMIENNEIDNKLIEKSYEKIINIKNKYKLNNDTITTKLELEKINSRISSINNLVK
ncbi:MAG: glycoside hydrolase family 3 protein [Bacilli bacterium]|nr:glycoside hydrolase family 3 protein [Bacilli bacterium]